MNYTHEVRSEIYQDIKNSDSYRKKAFLMGALKAVTNTNTIKKNKEVFAAEFRDEGLANCVSEILLDVYNIEHEIQEVDTDPKIFILTINNEDAMKMLSELKISHYENDKFVDIDIQEHLDDVLNMEKAQGYSQGVFCALGNVYFPGDDENDRGYHFELNLLEQKLALLIQLKLEESKINLTYLQRTNSYSLYSKKIESISDILAFLGASNAVLKLNEIMVQRLVNNDINRVANIEAANIDKVAIANAKYIAAIEKIDRINGLKYLKDKKLISIAQERLSDKTASMSALADKLGITKSSLSRALTKIVDIANKLED